MPTTARHAGMALVPHT